MVTHEVVSPLVPSGTVTVSGFTYMYLMHSADNPSSLSERNAVTLLYYIYTRYMNIDSILCDDIFQERLVYDYDI